MGSTYEPLVWEPRLCLHSEPGQQVICRGTSDSLSRPSLSARQFVALQRLVVLASDLCGVCITGAETGGCRARRWTFAAEDHFSSYWRRLRVLMKKWDVRSALANATSDNLHVAPTAAHAEVDRGKRRLVSRIFTSWNQLDGWLRQVSRGARTRPPCRRQSGDNRTPAPP